MSTTTTPRMTQVEATELALMHVTARREDIQNALAVFRTLRAEDRKLVARLAEPQHLNDAQKYIDARIENYATALMKCYLRD